MDTILKIAMAYILKQHAKIGTKIQVDVRGKRAEGVVVKGAFYQRNYE